MKMDYCGYTVEVAVASDQQVAHQGFCTIWLWDVPKAAASVGRPAVQPEHQEIQREISACGIEPYLMLRVYRDGAGYIGLQPAMVFPGSQAIGWIVVPKDVAARRMTAGSEMDWARNLATYELAEYADRLRKTVFEYRIYKDNPFEPVLKSDRILGAKEALNHAYGMIEAAKEPRWKIIAKWLLGKPMPALLKV